MNKRSDDSPASRAREPGSGGRVHLTGWLLCATMADADLVARMLADHIRLSRAEPGCLVFEVVRSMSEPTRFAVREVFATRTAFEAHGTRARASDWWTATGHIERDYRVSEDAPLPSPGHQTRRPGQDMP